jgi:hypothetical protein
MERTAYRGLPRVDGRARRRCRTASSATTCSTAAGSGWAGAHGRRGAAAGVGLRRGRDRTARVDVTHSIERIEPMGRDALVVGNERGGLTFSAVALDETPTVAGRHTVRNASQGETRSHGFFYLPDGDRAGCWACR